MLKLDLGQISQVNGGFRGKVWKTFSRTYRKGDKWCVEYFTKNRRQKIYGSKCFDDKERAERFAYSMEGYAD